MEKTLTKDVVKLELDRLILQNGNATTLEIKKGLRNLQYWATQNDVHNFVEQIFAENPTKYQRTVKNEGGIDFNVYTATTDWEIMVASKQTPTSLSDFESKSGPLSRNERNPNPIEPTATNEVAEKPSLSSIIDQINAKTPLHVFHNSIRTSSMTGSPIVAEYTPRTGTLRTINDLNKGTEHEVTDSSKPQTNIAKDVLFIIATTLHIDPKQIMSNSTFVDLGCDSLDAVEIIMEFEKTFEISIADNEAEAIKTVQEAINLIESKVTGTKTAAAPVRKVTSAAVSNNDDIREPIFIFYTMNDFEKHRSDAGFDPKNWVCHQRNNPQTEIHVYNKAVTRDQARSRFASKHKIKSGEVRCSTAANFNLQEA